MELKKYIKKIRHSFLHSVMVHHCHLTLTDMDADTHPRNMISHDSAILTKACIVQTICQCNYFNVKLQTML